MSIFKCKMCGGTLEINNNETVATCEYCGTQQTLPKLDDDKRANMYDRANHFRRNNDFDKAMGIYEQILNEDKTDAEAYWSLVLCSYGIEYVEDPATHKRIPTVNRAQFTSIFDDDNYKSALQYADVYQKTVYEQEAKAINEIQKGILAISQKEEPFDVFICYKETDNNGRRTQDSVLANDLYHQLTQEGFKVFFARITLEDKLGSAYEPYIFAALNSAKVMVVLGTKPEHFNAVWVKNEWSRYLSLIKKGQNKILIPAYKDMDPYDLPEEFSHLQAQDMSKLGFMQDLIRGIKKLAQTEPTNSTIIKETVVTDGNTNTTPLLKRAFMFLEDGDWRSADEYCEKVLDINPECAEAYLGKLMAELMISNKEKLKDNPQPFENLNNCQKAVRFADEKLKEFITNSNLEIKYRNACNQFHSSETEEQFKASARAFDEIKKYKNSADLYNTCLEKAENARKDAIYNNAMEYMNNNTVEDYNSAVKLFNSVPGWRDADNQIEICKKKIEDIKAKEEVERLERERKTEIARKKRKMIIKISSIIVSVVIIFLIMLNTVIIPSSKYNKALGLMEEKKYSEGIAAFEAMDGYKDSAAKIEECKRLAITNPVVGFSVWFGSYEQDNDTSNGKENIEWLVLAKEDNKILVTSKYALDCKQYNTGYDDVTWEICTLRKWLNNGFINSAFSEEEKAKIPTVTVSADKNPEYSTDPGNATKDKVFLLSIEEVNKYFKTDEARKCVPTDYAIEQGAHASSNYTKNGKPTCFWWLRSPGYAHYRAASVYNYGDVYGYGDGIFSGVNAVRPAMWIDLNS